MKKSTALGILPILAIVALLFPQELAPVAKWAMVVGHDYQIDTNITLLVDGANTKTYARMRCGSLPNLLALAKQLSPLTYVRLGLPPTITFQGDQDLLVAYQKGIRLEDALSRLGTFTRRAPVRGQLVAVPGGGHAGWSREENIRAQEPVFEFFHKHGIL